MRSPHWPRAVVLDSASRSDCVVSASTWVWRPGRLQLAAELADVLAPLPLGLLDQAVEPRPAPRASRCTWWSIAVCVPRSSSVPRRRSADSISCCMRSSCSTGSSWGAGRTPTGTRGAGDEDEHDEQPDHDDTQQRNHEFHVSNATTGV